MFSFTDKDIAEAKSGGVLPEGEYEGKVAAAEVTKSMAGHTTIAVEMQFSNGMKYKDRLNVEHPKSTEIATKNLIKILTNGVKNAKKNFPTYPELAAYLKGVPVKVRVKHKGQNEKGYTKYSISYLEPAEQITKGEGSAGVAF